VSQAQEKKRGYWNVKQSESRIDRAKEKRVKQALEHEDVAIELRRKRIEESIWRELRLQAVERYFEEKSNPSCAKGAA
jgi:hypothetical protein